MVYKRRKFRKKGSFKRKRSYRRVFRKKMKKSSIRTRPLPHTVYGNNLFTKLYYSDRVQLSAVSGATSVIHTWRLNSLYDTDVTSTGHQPRYFDHFCGLTGTQAPYEFYRVHAAKITGRFYNTNSTAASTARVCIKPYWITGAGIAAGTFASEFDELPNVSTGFISTMYSKPYTKVSRFVRMNKIFGVKDIKDDNNAQASYNSNPSKQAYCDIGVAPVDGATSANYFVDVKIVYFVEFFGLNRVAAS